MTSARRPWKRACRKSTSPTPKSPNVSEFSLKDGILDIPWDWSGFPGSFYPKTVQEKIETLL